MAGTTLRGIGDDEDEEGAGEKTPPPPSTPEDPQTLSGPTIVDSAKVAESLKKLRSLDDFAKTPPPALVPNPSGAQPPNPALNKTMMGGIGLDLPGKPVPPPALGTGTLFGIGVPNLTGSSGSHPGGSTTHTLAGVVAPGEIDDATIPTNAVSGIIERDVRGTVMGHDRHIGDRDRPPEGGRVITERGLSGDFSGGERHFFESEPINTEFEPEFKPNPYARVGVALAVAGVFIAAVWGYVRYRRFEPAPTEAQTAPAPAAAPASTPTPPPVAETPTPPPAATAPPTAAATEPAKGSPPAAQEPTPAAAAPEPTPSAAIAAPATTPTPTPPTEAPPPTPVPSEAIEPPVAKKTTERATKITDTERSSATKESDKPSTHPTTRPTTRPTTHPTPTVAADRPAKPVKEKAPILDPSLSAPPPRRAIRPVTSLEPTRAGSPPSKPSGILREMPSLAPPPRPARAASAAPMQPGATLPVPKAKPAKKRGEDDPDGTLPLSID